MNFSLSFRIPVPPSRFLLCIPVFCRCFEFPDLLPDTFPSRRILPDRFVTFSADFPFPCCQFPVVLVRGKMILHVLSYKVRCFIISSCEGLHVRVFLFLQDLRHPIHPALDFPSQSFDFFLQPPAVPVLERKISYRRFLLHFRNCGIEKASKSLRISRLSSILKSIDQRFENSLISSETAGHFRKHPRKLRWFCVFRSVLLDSGGL